MTDTKFEAEFHLGTLRLNALINTKEELSLRLKNIYPSEAPEYLTKAYTDFEVAINQLIKAEAKFLASPVQFSQKQLL